MKLKQFFLGKDSVCGIAKECKAVGPGETSSFRCKGQGKGRCKVKCVDGGNACSKITGCRTKVDCGNTLLIDGRRLGLGAPTDGLDEDFEYAMLGYTPLSEEELGMMKLEDEENEMELAFNDHSS